MKIATTFARAADIGQAVQAAVDLERSGLDLLWIPESYGFDAPTVLGYLLAHLDRVEVGTGIIPIYSRTPALIAMTAASADALSGGRFNLGLGSSGPQVVEGWHGVPYDAPVGRTREIIEICRTVWSREVLVHEGEHYTLPRPGGADRAVRPLKLIEHPVRVGIPTWVAALGPKNVAMTAEVADGWLPTMLIPECVKEVWGAALADGLSRRDPALGQLKIAGGGPLAFAEGEEVTRLRDLVRPTLALYIGGMGSKNQNFYNKLTCRYGFEKEAATIQDLYLGGRRADAAAAVPARLLELTSLIGPRKWVAEHVAALAEVGVTHLQVNPLAQADESPAEAISQLREVIS